MPVCQVATQVGDSYRYEWEPDDGSQGRFGFAGELLESAPPRREVATETMIGTDGPGATNEMTLTPRSDGTLLSVVTTYPDVATRDAVLDSGMVDGVDASYRRLDGVVAA